MPDYMTGTIIDFGVFIIFILYVMMSFVTLTDYLDGMEEEMRDKQYGPKDMRAIKFAGIVAASAWPIVMLFLVIYRKYFENVKDTDGGN